MRVHETFGLIPEGVLLLRADITDFHNGRRRVYTLAALEYRNKKFSQGIGVGVDLCLFPGLQRIEDDHILLIIEGLVSQADEIGADLAGLAVVDPVDGLVARVRDLLGVLGKLDLRDKFAGLSVLNGSLYTPPKAGQSLLVMRLVPTPQELILAPWVFRLSMRYSSRSLEAEM